MKLQEIMKTLKQKLAIKENKGKVKRLISCQLLTKIKRNNENENVEDKVDYKRKLR